ncbi:hypothetical protein B5X24_HaOG201935 [Helicoverpa armigera]|uniref:Luciferin 4-monooxygenase-like n=1 Tax=Helicoverpa armigera TaxID=29058 RepID=A0A2W1C0Z5_HELAM|nr:hypothetical protein B5X24_HaOG201935 [Helicoverpa armigera]
MAPNHLDQAVPFYAAMFLGIATSPIDRTLGVYELKHTLNISKPKMIFCQSHKVQDVQKAVELLGLDAKVVSFDSSPDTITLAEMMDKHGESIAVEVFRAADFDPEETIGYLISTSGTTGLPKSAIVTHKNMATSGIYICSFAKKFPPTRSALLVAPLQWLSSLLSYIMSPYYKYTRIQTSNEVTSDHTLELIERYKPTFMIISPTMMTTLVKAAKRANADLSSFEVLYLGGSAVPRNLVEELRKMVSPTATVTGDMMYRDERWNFYFVERIKLLLKYRNYQISPVEVENVILKHPGVQDVAVTSIPDEECGDLPVACVVVRPGAQVTAQEIKDLVKEKLTDTKQLRGGVIFLNELPLTTSTKLHRRKLKEIAFERLKGQVAA